MKIYSLFTADLYIEKSLKDAYIKIKNFSVGKLLMLAFFILSFSFVNAQDATIINGPDAETATLSSIEDGPGHILAFDFTITNPVGGMAANLVFSTLVVNIAANVITNWLNVIADAELDDDEGGDRRLLRQ